MNIVEELTCGDGTRPSGPVSAWPQDRHRQIIATTARVVSVEQPVRHEKKVRAGFNQMASGLAKVAGQAIVNGKVSEEVRNERYETCKNCPFFIEDSKRCSECGCFMEAKTWVGGNPDLLCPKQKWSR